MSNGLGYVHTRLGNHELAEACLREAHDRMQRSGGHDWGHGRSCTARAALAIDGNRLDDARASHAGCAASRGCDPAPAFRVSRLVVAERLMCALGAFDAAARLHGLLMQARKTGLMPFPDDARHRRSPPPSCRDRSVKRDCKQASAPHHRVTDRTRYRECPRNSPRGMWNTPRPIRARFRRTRLRMNSACTCSAASK